MMKKTLLSLSIISLLSACGGSSSDSNDNTANSNSGTEYRVIDGYLVNADVCIIEQDTTDCTDIGQTDNDGIIVIPENFTAGKIVVTATAGQTSDKDSVGFIGQTYQMMANISTETPNVITPYTTIDVLDTSQSIADIADNLGLDEVLLSGDYVASNASQKAQVHALARALAIQLSTQQEENDVAELMSQATEINDYIESELINNGVDLDSYNIFINDEGETTHKSLISSLSDFLEGNELTQFSLNTSYFKEEGTNQVTFSDGVIYFGSEIFNYKIDGNQLTISINSDEETDQFIYVSNELSLAVPLAEQDLSVMYKQTDEISTWTKDDLIGETFYFVFDDSADSKIPDPSLVKISFSESTAIMLEEGQTQEINWSLDNGLLTLDLSTQGEADLILSPYFADDNITLIKSVDDNRLLTLIAVKDENLATNIISQWLLLSK
ncbi:hypothetical protein [Psychromonas sp. L1A2]|uniref:hypothetical protein n=1 Tax=Psychromonas sp. L1A2 TaxID=2686356 RepID=UPI001356EE38|nr:hypothetical protein [Psychromonas sp. L1A2]